MVLSTINQTTMINNSTSINKTNNHLASKLDCTQKRQQHNDVGHSGPGLYVYMPYVVLDHVDCKNRYLIYNLVSMTKFVDNVYSI